MTDREDRELLAQFGLSGVELGPAEKVDWPAPAADEAKGTATLLFASALLTAQPPATEEARIDTLDRAGLMVRVVAQEPRILKLSSSYPEAGIEVQAPHAKKDAVASSREYPDVVVVDTRKSGRFLVQIQGNRVICAPSDEGLETRPVVGTPRAHALERVPGPELELWLNDCRDAWLVDHVTALREAGDSWSVTVAAGAYARLIEPEAAEAARARVEALLTGKVDEQLARPRRWIRGLSGEQLSTLEDLARAEIDRLHEGLQDVAAAVEAADSTWTSDWIATCRGRDDLEGVLLLLREIGRETAIAVPVAALDREGRRTRLGVPPFAGALDEQLRRASRRNPDAWWAAVGL